MSRHVDHVVLWVEDPLASVEFFERIAGFAAVRMDEFRAGKTMFPSVRISEHSLLDLMPRRHAPRLNERSGAASKITSDSAGHPVHHICIAMDQEEFDALQARLEANGMPVVAFMENSFGAQGQAPRTFYFHDPDGNVFEARYYAD
jgi:catechol 2,3-dioxygenase-like lactoylglutathione lyase family enzyme